MRAKSIEEEVDVNRITVECTAAAEAQPLLHTESVARRTERAAIRNERWTPVALRVSAIQLVSEGVSRRDEGGTWQHHCCRNAGDDCLR